MSQNAKEIYRSWIDAVNGRQWDDAVQLLAPSVTVNTHELDREALIGMVKSHIDTMPDIKTSIDLTIVDKSGTKAAVRQIHRGSVTNPLHLAKVTGEAIEWVEQLFFYLDDGKIAKIITLRDVDAINRNNQSVPVTPPSERSAPAQAVDMASAYRTYLDSVNNNTMAEHFPSYVQPTVIHMGNTYTRDQYREMIAASQTQIENLSFNMADVVVDEESQMVASQIHFTGRPVTEFMGVQPTGKEVEFSEFAFYQLNDGKICRVWSVWDMEAYRKSIGAT